MIEIPGYTIKREISAGEMSNVYLALQTSLERDVALKTISPAMAADASYAGRFLQVARALAAFSHPNIVAVYDVGVDPAQLQYFSMQYLPGGDFAARVLRGMSEQQLAETLAGVARALGYVHQRGLIHRAVAPKNIMYDSGDTPVLIDFGIAPSVSQEAHITSAGFAIGTSHYMSPEQARGSEVDARSDIYSLGASCYFGLVGRPPYDGADGFAVAYAHVFEPIPRLPPAQAHWQPLIDGALAKDPKDRYSKIEEFLDALTSVTLNQEARVAAAAMATPDEATPPRSGQRPPVEDAVPTVAEVAAPAPVVVLATPPVPAAENAVARAVSVTLPSPPATAPPSPIASSPPAQPQDACDGRGRRPHPPKLDARMAAADRGPRSGLDWTGAVQSIQPSAANRRIEQCVSAIAICTGARNHSYVASAAGGGNDSR